MPILRRRGDGDLEELRELDLFSTADDDELRRVRRLSEVAEVAEGTVFTEEDEFEGGGFFVILDGTASVRRADASVRTLEPGAFFGEMGAIEPRKRSATVTADDDMRVLVFSRTSFDQLLADAPSVTRKIIREMGRRLRTIEEELAER